MSTGSLRRLSRIAAVCMLPVMAAGQEGFPLDGTWRGEWGDTGSPENHVVVIMKWNGETVTGRINPGPNSIDFDTAWLEPASWGVHIEATGKDGEAIRIDGTLSDIGSRNRRISGTWQIDDTQHDFEIVRE